ncbi:MAG: 7-carboxy-7-deazaguanine synthase QueE [Candidatus Contendobacter odensis]|uniref:7-carboxy-7-deazaguanine synthase n=1 Tax=Candidatus Contendibacter odensensis TaxID=1400860 RepID=A0A2G6PFM7_9GAMM|nr:MAG: 7-carboxy-7-deazaguanine synthase QueE [Candidatus Contendobacter odensis]
MDKLIKISEIFGPTLQGEGVLIGQSTVFVRTGGCDYRCSWCDTPYAVKCEYRRDWVSMSAEQIFEEVSALSCGKPLMVSLSGGNPAIHPLQPLIDIGHTQGYRFGLETQGSVAQDWFKTLDVLTLSPKPPSSTMETDWKKLDDCIAAANGIPKTVLKMVVLDEEDYRYTREVASRYPALPVYLQPGNHKTEGDADLEGLNQRLLWLASRVNADQWFNVTILPQLHVLLWGNKRGV